MGETQIQATALDLQLGFHFPLVVLIILSIGNVF